VRDGGAAEKRSPASRRHRAALLGAATIVGAVAVACSGASGEGREADPTEYCEHLQAASALTVAFDELDLEALRSLVPELEAAAPIAPDEVRSATGTVAIYAREVLDQWEAADPLDATSARQAFRTLDDERREVEQAGRTLEAFAQEECGVNLRHPPTTTTTQPRTTASDEDTTTTSLAATSVVAPLTTWTPAPTASLPPNANTTTPGLASG
jgi:hypothetical protein